jgi:PAS domain S-box-containing protein
MKRPSTAGGRRSKGPRRKTLEPKDRNASKTGRGRSSSSAADEDVAVARRLEQSLRASEERYALVAEAVAEGIYDWNIKTNALYVSPRLMEIFSFEGTGITSDAWYARVHPEDREGYRTALRNCFKRRSSKLECQYRIKAADSSYRWIEDHGLPVRDNAGWAIRLVGAVSDVTLRHQTEQALRDRDQELNAVLDAIDYGVLFMGRDLRAKIINRAFRKMWGISDEFIRETRPSMSDLINYNRHNNLYDVPSAEFDEYVARRVEAVRGGAASISEMRRLDGRIIRYQVLALPDGGRMLTYFDITDLMRSQEQLRQRTADLTESLEQQTATSEVLGVISRSKFELQPILQSVVDTASQLCRADVSVIFRLESGVYRFAAGYSLDPAYLEHERRTPISPGPGTVVGRAALSREVVQIEDAWTDPLYEQKSGGKNCRRSFDDRRPVNARRRADRRHWSRPHPSGTIYTTRNRAGDDIRRPGSDSNRECAAIRGGATAHARTHGIAGAADRCVGGASSHQ